MDCARDIIQFMKRNDISEIKFGDEYIFKIEYRLENVSYKIMNKFRTVIIDTYDIEWAIEEIEKRRNGKNV